LIEYHVSFIALILSVGQWEEYFARIKTCCTDDLRHFLLLDSLWYQLTWAVSQ